MISPARALAAIAAASALSGRGIANPNAQTTPGRAPDGLRTPRDVIDAQRDPFVRRAVDYTLTQAMWSADTYVAQRGRLAELATGQARAQLTPRDGQSPVGVAAALKAAGASSTATLLGTDGPTRSPRRCRRLQGPRDRLRTRPRKHRLPGRPRHAHPSARRVARLDLRDRAMTVHPPGQPLAAPSSSCTTRTVLTRCLLLVGLAIAGVTLLAAIASARVPELGPGRAPRPTLHATPTEALTIFLTNAQTLIAPLILVAGRWHTGRVTRHVGDLVVGALVLANPMLVGFALGRYPTQLPAYLPHIALEYAALALAASAWLTRRLPNHRAQRSRSLLGCATLTLIVAAIAAVVETYAVPHQG